MYDEFLKAVCLVFLLLNWHCLFILFSYLTDLFESIVKLYVYS